MQVSDQKFFADENLPFTSGVTESLKTGRLQFGLLYEDGIGSSNYKVILKKIFVNAEKLFFDVELIIGEGLLSAFDVIWSYYKAIYCQGREATDI